MDPCVPLPLAQDKLEDLVDKAKDYCLMHGNVSKKIRCNKCILLIGYFLPSRHLHETQGPV